MIVLATLFLAAVLTPTPTPLPAPPCGGTVCQPLAGRPCNEGAWGACCVDRNLLCAEHVCHSVSIVPPTP
jgi:hypothetical protein